MAGLESHIENVTEKDGTLILRMKPEVFDSAENYIALLDTADELKKKLRIEEYVRGQFKHDAYEYQIEIRSLYIDTLKAFFRTDMEKEDIAEAINFLQKHGWSETQFQGEIGISRPTYFRYLSEAKATAENSYLSQPETTSTATASQ
jgi:hypothetical protein